MTTPAHDVAQFIADNVAGLTLGTNLRVGDEETPVVVGRDAFSINVTDVPGVDAEPFVDGGDRTRIERPSASIMLRGDKDDPRMVRSMAVMLADVLDLSSFGPWFDCRVQGSGPLSLGRDEEGFPRASLTVRLQGWVEQFPLYHGAAPVPGLIDQAWLDATLATSSRGRRNLTFSAAALAGDRLWVAFPQSLSGPVAAPLRLYDGLTSRTTLATALQAGGVAVLVRGAPVLYDVHATAAAVAAGAHIAKVL